jgi:heterodisulfide reductase subunit A-like polyferredoxin
MGNRKQTKGESSAEKWQTFCFRTIEEPVMKAETSKNVQGSVMVVGGGIAGMQAALDLADSGFFVHLVEKSPAIGGVMSQLDKTFPTNDCAM